jgi:hypothetical protein
VIPLDDRGRVDLLRQLVAEPQETIATSLEAARRHGMRGNDEELLLAMKESFYETRARIGLNALQLSVVFWLSVVCPLLPRDEREPWSRDGV